MNHNWATSIFKKDEVAQERNKERKARTCVAACTTNSNNTDLWGKFMKVALTSTNITNITNMLKLKLKFIELKVTSGRSFDGELTFGINVSPTEDGCTSFGGEGGGRAAEVLWEFGAPVTMIKISPTSINYQ
jgi:hypothetical protein